MYTNLYLKHEQKRKYFFFATRYWGRSAKGQTKDNKSLKNVVLLFLLSNHNFSVTISRVKETKILQAKDNFLQKLRVCLLCYGWYRHQWLFIKNVLFSKYFKFRLLRYKKTYCVKHYEENKTFLKLYIFGNKGKE